VDADEFRGLIGDYLTDNLGFGKGKRLELNEVVLEKTRSFRCEPLWGSWGLMVGTSFMKCWIVCIRRSQNVSRLSRKVWSLEGAVLRVDIKLDPGFSQFYDWTLENNVPVVVLSSGMEPIIRALLAKLIGPKADGIPIISNNVDIAPDGTWKIVFRDESRTPHRPPCVGDVCGSG
jgi:2-hydroxy-3-keto-5-methylthiopentenyl-1-phosphate phosphatase